MPNDRSAYQRAYRAQNADRLREYRQARNAANPEPNRNKAALWRVKNPDRYFRNMRAHKCRKRGITLADYDAMLASQGGKCAICGTVECDGRTADGKPWSLAIDHCHKSGRVRGLLCRRCNQALGKFNDDPELFEKAAAYLRNYANP